MDARIEIAQLLEHAGWLRNLAGSLVRDSASADDLVQDTWVAVLRQPPGAEPRAWLARVAGNLARNARRARARRAEREESAGERQPSPTPEAILQEAEAQRLLAEAVTRLAEDLRVVVVLRYFRGLDSTAIARELGLSASAVRTRLQKALEALRIELDRRFGGDRRAWSVLLAPYLPHGLAGAAAAGATAFTWGAATWIAGAGAAVILATIGVATWKTGAGAAESASAVRSSEPAPLVAVSTPERAELRAADRTSLAPDEDSTSAAPTPDSTAEMELSGRILVDGRPAEWPIELELEAPEFGASEDWKTLMHGRFLHLQTEVVQPDLFSFGMLPAGWSGRVRVSHETFANGESTLELGAPVAGLVLHLLSNSALSGRFVDARGKALDTTRFSYKIVQTYGDKILIEETSGALDCRDDGRFRVPVYPNGQLATGTLLVETEHGYLHFETPSFLPTKGLDVGDLTLEPVAALAFRVLDPKGQPIAGAFARVDGPHGSRRSELTDDQGASVLHCVPERRSELRFSAFRYADRVVTVEPGDSFEVVLEPLSTLAVQLVGPAEAFEYRGDLVVSALHSLFVWDDDHWGAEAELQSDLGATTPAEWRWGSEVRAPEDAFQAIYRPRAENRFILVGLRPGVPFEVEVRDKAGRTLALRSLALAAGEWAALELPLGP